MQDEESITAAERELASALGRLRPERGTIDRDEVMFRAGRASARRRGHYWQGATALLVCGLGVSLFTRPAPREIERIVTVAAPGPVLEDDSPTDVAVRDWRRGVRQHHAEYLRLRQAVLARGIDALPVLGAPRSKVVGDAESLEQSLGVPQGTLDDLRYPRARFLSNQGEQS